MEMWPYWKYKCDQVKLRINDLVAMRKYKGTQQKRAVSFKCKTNELTELITQLLTENEDLISLIKPLVKQLNTETSLQKLYTGLEENLNITIELNKSIAFITEQNIFKYTTVLIDNMLNIMKVKECLTICLDEQDPTINYISWNCERYINHLQVLITLLTSGDTKPLMHSKSVPCVLTARPLHEVIKEIHNRPYFHRGNPDYDENQPQSRNFMLRESTSETPKTSCSDFETGFET